MSFASGSLSFRQFLVIGQSPPAPDQKLLDALAAQAFQPMDDAVSAEEVEYGWSGGSHLYDGAFTFEKNVYVDCLFFALRVDTNRVPGEVVRSWTAVEEATVAAGNPSGFLSKAQKRAVKESIRQKVDAEQRGGKHRRSRAIPVLWDLARCRVYSPVSGANFEKLAEIFERTFRLDLRPLTVGILCERITGRTHAFEDLRPSAFASHPLGDVEAEYPWIAKSADAKLFLGNEFLMWSIYQAAEGLDDTLFFDRKLDLECAFGASGRHAIKGNAPDRMREVHEALSSGKVPRKAGVTAMIGGGQFEFMFDPEVVGFASLKLPNVEDAETPRVLFEERIEALRTLTSGIDAAFARFLSVRLSGWEATRAKVAEWAAGEAVPETAKA